MAQTNWKPGDNGTHPDRADKLVDGLVYRPDFFEHVKSIIAALDRELNALSLDIHGGFPRVILASHS